MTETNDVSESEPATDEVVGEEAVAEPDPLAEIMAERDKIKDQLLRTAADFDNFRKRTRRDLDDAASRSREDLLREILPIFDNLERAVVAAETAADAASVAEGAAKFDTAPLSVCAAACTARASFASIASLMRARRAGASVRKTSTSSLRASRSPPTRSRSRPSSMAGAAVPEDAGIRPGSRTDSIAAKRSRPRRGLAR